MPSDGFAARQATAKADRADRPRLERALDPVRPGTRAGLSATVLAEVYHRDDEHRRTTGERDPEATAGQSVVYASPQRVYVPLPVSRVESLDSPEPSQAEIDAVIEDAVHAAPAPEADVDVLSHDATEARIEAIAASFGSRRGITPGMIGRRGRGHLVRRADEFHVRDKANERACWERQLAAARPATQRDATLTA